MANYETLLFEVRDGVGFVTVNRPDALNALNTRVIAELDAVFRLIRDADDVKAVILTGAGKAFVAGADIAQMSELGVSEGREMARTGQRTLSDIEALDKPVIAAVNGFALGGGCELAMVCDVRFASEKAKFGQPEVNLGITPGFGGTQRLSRLVGEGTAKYLIYGGEIINAREAYRIGLVQNVFPAETLMAEAEKYARLILTKAPIAVRMSKIAINTGGNMDLRSGVAYEAEAYTVSFASEDRREGMRAFLEKRPAVFRGR